MQSHAAAVGHEDDPDEGDPVEEMCLLPLRDFRPGMNVILHGLTSRADLNGKDGYVTRDEAPVGRISVMVLADALKGAPPIAVLPKNLLLPSEKHAVARFNQTSTSLYDMDWSSAVQRKETKRARRRAENKYYENTMLWDDKAMECVLLSWRCLLLSRNGRRNYLRKRATLLLEDVNLEMRDYNIRTPFFGTDVFLAELRKIRTAHLSPRSAAAFEFDQDDSEQDVFSESSAELSAFFAGS
jgi:hypothetical protein